LNDEHKRMMAVRLAYYIVYYPDEYFEALSEVG
jgi:DNA polymerase III alpha subunit (gram-positive type)